MHKHFWQTWVFAFIYYFWAGFGITAGYHRLWSHRAYRVNTLLEYFLMVGGTGALQGSIKWWCLLHRAHHRYTDTEDDPYNAQRGFFYAHFGWLLLDNVKVKKSVDIDDLKAVGCIRWQHRNYHWFGPFMSLIFPTLVCSLLWGDIRGGFYIAGCFRLLFIHHATWCVNSVAHYFGDFTFDDTISPRDHIITSLLTLGEGYHNFHHEFPNDYRNGIHWWDYDPTKWFIGTMNYFGCATDLISFNKNEIVRGETDMQQKNLDKIKSTIDYGRAIEDLPPWNWEKIQAEVKDHGRILIVVKKVVLDVKDFLMQNKHPGGKKIIIDRNGKDCTKEFNGGVYNHTNAARNLMSHMRVARLVE
jgi:stearoyl-CoA desaturase (delta-9 desaturase)